jgi:hypothetical protein
MAIVAAFGTNSRRSSSRFATSSSLSILTPVRFRPGRLRLSTKPSSTGSRPVTKTIGSSDVAAFAATAVLTPPIAAMTATRRRTTSPPKQIPSYYSALRPQQRSGRYSLGMPSPVRRAPGSGVHVKPEAPRAPQGGWPLGEQSGTALLIAPGGGGVGGSSCPKSSIDRVVL